MRTVSKSDKYFELRTFSTAGYPFAFLRSSTLRIHCVLFILTCSPKSSAQTVSASGGDSCTIQWEPINQINCDPCASVAPQVIAVGDTIHLLWVNLPGIIPRQTDSLLGIFYSHRFDRGKTFSPQCQLLRADKFTETKKLLVMR